MGAGIVLALFGCALWFFVLGSLFVYERGWPRYRALREMTWWVLVVVTLVTVSIAHKAVAGPQPACWHVVADNPTLVHPHPAKARAVCERGCDVAGERGVPCELAAAIMIRENGFQEAPVSSAGAVGPFQILPRYFLQPDARELNGLPRKHRGLYHAGVDAIAYWSRRSSSVREMLARFNGGNNPSPRAWAYSRAVMETATRAYARRFGDGLFDGWL